MSEKEKSTIEKASKSEIKLNGLYAFKEAMTSVYTESGEIVPVTVLRYEPWFVSQIKTLEKDGYAALQLVSVPKKRKNSLKSEVGQAVKAGFENGARFVKEMRVGVPEGVELGSRVSIESLEKGQVVTISSTSKGRGFAGSVKRFNFGGGPAAHGSKFHRRPGSSGNRTWPGRVMPGKRFPGHFGDEQITVKNVQIVDVIPSEKAILVKGAVPGSRNTLVRLVKG